MNSQMLRAGRIVAAVGAGVVVVAAFAAPAVGAPLANGSFDGGSLAHWAVDGDVVGVLVGTNGHVRMEETLLDGSTPLGGRSRLYQVFTLPVGATEVSFRYRLVHGPAVRPTAVPPDSFTAFLLTGDGTARVLPSDPSADPAFCLGYFYADADGVVAYDGRPDGVWITEAGPGSDGLTTVRLDVSTIAAAGEPVRLEFGFASADNGVTSYVVVDGVAVDGFAFGPCESDWDTSSCGIQSTADCRWHTPGGACANHTDPVMRHMCTKGIYLDGDVADAIAAGAIVAVDQVPSRYQQPGPEGWDDAPRFLGYPTGFNIGKSLLLFAPDSNPADGVDDSFLYVAWDIADPVRADGRTAVPFDATGDGCASRGHLDLNTEYYYVRLQACPALPYDPTSTNPNDIAQDGDLVGQLHSLDCSPDDPPVSHMFSPFAEVVSFPTTDLYTIDPADAVNPTNACIDQELRYCARGNNVELVIKRPESLPYFGEHAYARRMALSRTLAQLRGKWVEIDEFDYATICAQTVLPAVEVSNAVRLAGQGGDFATALDVYLSGSVQHVEYRMRIENRSNADVELDVSDLLTSEVDEGSAVSVHPECQTLVATLTRGGIDYPIDENPDPSEYTPAQVGLNGPFFRDDCAYPTIGFIGAVRRSIPITLTGMRPAQMTRSDGTCVLEAGDVLTLEFTVRLTVTEPGGCGGDGIFGTVASHASVAARLPGSAEPGAWDAPGVIDTESEFAAGADDNVATVYLRCED